MALDNPGTFCPNLMVGILRTMGKGTTEPGYRNRNRQIVVRSTNLAGKDHNQYVYVLRCEGCGREYGENESDIDLRKWRHN